MPMAINIEIYRQSDRCTNGVVYEAITKKNYKLKVIKLRVNMTDANKENGNFELISLIYFKV